MGFKGLLLIEKGSSACELLLLLTKTLSTHIIRKYKVTDFIQMILKRLIMAILV